MKVQPARLDPKGRKWRLMTHAPMSAPDNMAVDEALVKSHAEGVSLPVLRLYRWEPPGLSFGYFQSFSREVDPENCQKRGIDWVRRMTGGRAVLHQHELTYAVILHTKLLPGSVMATYRALSEALVRGFKGLGLDAELASGPAPTSASRSVGSAACFDSATPFELVVQGRKVVGSAQGRQHGVLLQHGSVPLQLDRDAIVDCLNLGSPSRRRAVRRTLENKAISLSEALGRPVEFDETARALAQGFRDQFRLCWVEEDLTLKETASVRTLSKEKYASENWNQAIK